MMVIVSTLDLAVGSATELCAEVTRKLKLILLPSRMKLWIFAVEIFTEVTNDADDGDTEGPLYIT